MSTDDWNIIGFSYFELAQCHLGESKAKDENEIRTLPVRGTQRICFSKYLFFRRIFAGLEI